jgi:hypothetical protein
VRREEALCWDFIEIIAAGKKTTVMLSKEPLDILCILFCGGFVVFSNAVR